MAHADNNRSEQWYSAASSSARFAILVCIDGSDEAYKALRYAVRIGSGSDADLTLLYVRPIDQGLRTGGLQISVARENMLEWGLELPGMKVLKNARDILVDLDWLGENWEEEFANTGVGGDPLGDQVTVYTNDEGRSITLKLHVAPSVEHGILDQCGLGNYDLTIIAKSEAEAGIGLGFIEPAVADRVAMEHSGAVLVTRALEENHGHLLCVTDNEASIRGARADAEIAARCACPIYLFSVASQETNLEAAHVAITDAKRAIEDIGVKPSGEKVVVGDPVTKIVEEGQKHSVIVLTRHKSRKGWRRMLSNSVAYKVLKRALNSVLIMQ